MKIPKQVKQKIVKSRDIVIVCHVNPDGDAIGSLLALGSGLAALGKRVHMISPDGVPKRYSLLPGAIKIKKSIRERCDMAIAVDCNAKEMLGESFGTIKNSRYILEIDHHEFRKPFGNLFFIDTKAAAVGELIYELLKELKARITRNIAQNILTSIIVETNSFRLPTVKPITFIISADLLGRGVDFHKLSEMVYWSKTKEAVILSGVCMSKMKFFKKGKIAWSIITKKEFSGIHGKDEDVDSVATDMLSITTVRIAILFREKNKKLLRVSLRSKGGVNIGQIAVKYGGGGHFDSAGCHIPNRKDSIEELLRLTRKLVTSVNLVG